MFWSIQTFSVNGKFTEHYHIFCACFLWTLPHLFTIFNCSHYRLLLHFGFIMCVNSRLYCTHFSCHWRKICNVSRWLTQISKRQHDPWYLWIIMSVNNFEWFILCWPSFLYRCLCWYDVASSQSTNIRLFKLGCALFLVEKCACIQSTDYW